MTTAVPNYATKGVTLLKDAQITAISLVDKGANNHEFFLFKRATDYVTADGHLEDRTPEPEVSKFSPLLKMATPTGDWKVAYCVVAVPGEIDQQKDVWNEEEIKKAAHEFMKGSPIINYMHQDLSKIGSLVESAIAPVDVDVDGYTIKKGSWYVGIEPFDSIKADIDAGKIRGVSVQGTSKREDVHPADVTKFIDTNELHKNYAMPGAMPDDVPDTSSEIEAAAPQEIPNAYPTKETIHIPKGASGPGIKILQRIVGLSQTGVYDQTTEAEFVNFLSEHGLDPEPTLEILQSILRQLAQRGHEEAAAQQGAAVEPTAEAPVETSPAAPVEGGQAPAAPDSPATPTATATPPATGVATPVAKDSDGAFNPAGQATPPVPNINSGTLASQVTPDTSPDDLKQMLVHSVQTGNQLLAQHLRDVHGVDSPDAILQHEFDPQMLQFMVNVFVLGKMPTPGAGAPQAESPSMVQAGYTPRELMPAGAGQPIHKRWLPDSVKESDLDDGDFAWVSTDGKTRKLPYKVHGKVSTDGWEAAWKMKGHTDTTGGPSAKAVEEKLLRDKPEGIEKGVWDGSLGGHDPDANGKIKYIVRSFGTWARGQESVAAKKLLEHGVVKTEEAANRLAAWLKDQWLHSTKWRNKSKSEGKAIIDAAMHKRFESILPDLKAQNLGLSAAAVETLLVKMAEETPVQDDYDLAAGYSELHDNLTDAFQFAADENKDDYRAVLAELREQGDAFDEGLQKRFAAPQISEQLDHVSKSAGTMTAEEYTKRFDSAMRAVTLGLVDALSVSDSAERLNDVSHVMSDFDRWARDFANNSVPEVDNYEEPDMTDVTKAANLVGETVMDTDGTRYKVLAQDGDTLTVAAGGKKKKISVGAVTVVESGAEEMAEGERTDGEPVQKSATLDRERIARLMETVSVLNDAIEEASPAATEDDSDTHVEAPDEHMVDPEYEGYEPENPDEVGAEGDQTVESTEDATELTKEDDNTQEETPMSDTTDTGSNLNDVIHFCNDLADSLEEVVGRFSEFDGIGSKIEKVGELAKNLDVSDRISQLEDQVKQLTEALAPAQEAAEATQEVAKRLEVIENQSGERTSVLTGGQEEVAIAKSASAPLFTRGGSSLF